MDEDYKPKRDYNIRKSYKKEINLQTREIKPKNKYKRKEKYKKNFYND